MECRKIGREVEGAGEKYRRRKGRRRGVGKDRGEQKGRGEKEREE